MEITTQQDTVQYLKEKLHETEQELKEKVFIIDTILESTLAGYWDWKIEEGEEYLSPAFKKMFGYKDHELPNTPESWQKIIHPNDLPKVMEDFRRHVDTEGAYPYDNEVRYYHKDGSIVWVFCKGKVVEWGQNGEPLRMIGCHINKTPLKKALETLEIQKKEKEQLKEFTYIASHDLQEPLHTIISCIDLLQEYKERFDEDGKIYLNFMSESAHRMSHLIKDLLDYSRIGKNKKITTITCNKVVKTLQDDLAKYIRDNNAELIVGDLPVIQGYETDVRLLFQNLITNAIKFHKKDTTPVVQISAQKEKVTNQWKFFIKDNGIGIPKKYQQKIFVIFKRLHSKQEYEGTGIGLSHCQKIVELHGGKIGVTSEPGQGSTFFFTIPTKY